MLAADDTLSLDMRLAPAVDTRQRNFWIALLIALAVHAALLVEISRSGREHELRRLGSQSGADNAIAVELVTAADLKSLSSVATPPEGGAPAFKPPIQPQEVQPQEAPPQEAQPQETPPPPQPDTQPALKPKAAEPPPAPEPKTVETKTAEPAVTAEAKPQPAAEPTPTVPDFETLAPEFAEPAPKAAKETPPETKKAEPAPAEKQAQPEAAQKQVKSEAAEKQAKPQPPAKKKQQQAKLDLSPPSTMPNPSSSGPGRSTAATRPAGITRSGENDRFGIAAIRALAQTFPMLSNTYGRVTVRLLLNENGDLVDVRVVQSSGKPQLDQSVVFSTRQASFPLPPRGSTEIDRTFIVTYVYR